jgi:hypothetical protein
MIRRLLHRLNPGSTRKATLAISAVLIDRPIAIAHMEPDEIDRQLGACWWGQWCGDSWLWSWALRPTGDQTHWLPAGVEVLPVRCCMPEAQR